MRILAALTALFCCTFEGFRRCFALKKRAANLSEILIMLGNFSIEIRCRALTLDELINGENCAFAQLVRAGISRGENVKDAWENACRTLPKYPERELLSELGLSFGTSDRDGQTCLLELYSAQLSALKTEAEQAYSKKGSALAKVGALCGAAAAILII